MVPASGNRSWEPIIINCWVFGSFSDQGTSILEQAKETIAKANPRNRRVLVVESDPDLQWKLARMLTVQGNRVVGTGSGDGAIALIKEWPVDLVLVAEELPGMGGLEVSRKLAEIAADTPIILMAEERPDVQHAARLAGAAACMIKPFRLDALRTLIDSVIDSVQLVPTPAE